MCKYGDGLRKRLATSPELRETIPSRLNGLATDILMVQSQRKGKDLV